MEQIGISLSGGSLKGAAHIGTLIELEARGIEITHIAGTSAGALIGGLYASGVSTDELKDIIRTFCYRDYIDINIGVCGLIKGDKIYEVLLKATKGKHFKDLEIPFAAVCVDLVSGQERVITEGEVALAIRASIAIPGVFKPVIANNEVLVDGYILNNNPANIVKQLGADKVLAIQVEHLQQDYRHLNVLSQTKRVLSIVSQHLTARIIEEYADYVVHIYPEELGRLEKGLELLPSSKLMLQAIDLGQKEMGKLLNQQVA